MTNRRVLFVPRGRFDGRPAGVPTLVTSRLANSAVWFDDLFLTDFGTAGNPSWQVNNIAGTGTVSPNSTATAPGTLLVTTGSTLNDCTTINGNVRAASSNAGGNFLGAFDWLLQVRGSPGAAVTTVRQGWAMFSNSLIPLATNWLNGPVAALSTSNYLALVRDTGVTPSGGAAGDWALYVGDSGASDSQIVRLGAATIGSFQKCELYWSDTAKTLSVYWDGVSVAVLAMPNTTFLASRFECGAQTLTGATRSFNLDSIYYECVPSIAR